MMPDAVQGVEPGVSASCVDSKTRGQFGVTVTVMSWQPETSLLFPRASTSPFGRLLVVKFDEAVPSARQGMPPAAQLGIGREAL